MRSGFRVSRKDCRARQEDLTGLDTSDGTKQGPPAWAFFEARARVYAVGGFCRGLRAPDDVGLKRVPNLASLPAVRSRVPRPCST